MTNQAIFKVTLNESTVNMKQVEMEAGLAATSNNVIDLAASGDIVSLIHLIIKYLRSMDFNMAEFALKKASDAGYIPTTLAMIRFYYYGLGECGLTGIIRNLRKASYSYHLPSMYVLARLLQESVVLQYYPQEANDWVHLATVLDPMREFEYSHKFLDASEVDDESLIEDVVSTLEAPLVIFDLGKAAASAKRLSIPMPKSGNFVKLNGKPEPWEAFKEFSPEVSFKMIRQAAENGFVTAMYHLSSMFRCGYGTEPDPDLADAWFYAARRLDEQNKGLRMVDFTIN